MTMADVIIRQATAEDADDIYEIENLCFPDPWSSFRIIRGLFISLRS